MIIWLFDRETQSLRSNENWFFPLATTASNPEVVGSAYLLDWSQPKLQTLRRIISS